MSNLIDFPKSSLIPVNGVELEVFEAAQQNAGNPIVLCHGWPEHAYSWRHQVPALVEAGYHVIVPNQRGNRCRCGASLFCQTQWKSQIRRSVLRQKPH